MIKTEFLIWLDKRIRDAIETSNRLVPGTLAKAETIGMIVALREVRTKLEVDK